MNEKSEQATAGEGKGLGVSWFMTVLAVALFIGGCTVQSPTRYVLEPAEFATFYDQHGSEVIGYSPEGDYLRKNESQNKPLGIGMCIVAVILGLVAWSDFITQAQWRKP